MTAGLEVARALFETIGRRTFDGVGFTRAAYGEGEQVAHDIVGAVARDLGLHVEVDAALNMSMTLSGAAGDGTRLLLGSHLDAVPQGGNFDGLAGVLAGLSTLAAFRHGGLQLRRDVTLMAIRAEESAWFGAQHIGSRALLGTLPAALLDTARRVDSGRSIAEHMRDAGVDVERLRQGTALCDLRQVRGYLELHIEQGPILVAKGLPLGIVTGIRGNRRCRRAVCTGEYGHSGTVPRSLRHDAVFAVADLVRAMDEVWERIEREGGDLVLTFGRFATDPAASNVTTVPGEVTFCFDARSHSVETLDHVEAELARLTAGIERSRGVSFTYDPMTGDAPAIMDAGFRDMLANAAETLAIPAIPIASGAGHDAGDFSAAGIRSAMIFVRNDKGSHNPAEAMEFDDFAEGVRLMTAFVAAEQARGAR